MLCLYKSFGSCEELEFRAERKLGTKKWSSRLVSNLFITSSKTTASLLLHNSILSARICCAVTFDKQNIAFLGKCHSISKAI